ncbi:hypothetical protein V2J09_002829 [Rumex salicifolius]
MKCTTIILPLDKNRDNAPFKYPSIPYSPNSLVNLSCTSRSDLLTVGLCFASTLSKSDFMIGGGLQYPIGQPNPAD